MGLSGDDGVGVFAHLYSDGALYAPLVTYMSDPLSYPALPLLKADGARGEPLDWYLRVLSLSLATAYG